MPYDAKDAPLLPALHTKLLYMINTPNMTLLGPNMTSLAQYDIYTTSQYDPFSTARHLHWHTIYLPYHWA